MKHSQKPVLNPFYLFPPLARSPNKTLPYYTYYSTIRKRPAHPTPDVILKRELYRRILLVNNGASSYNSNNTFRFPTIDQCAALRWDSPMPDKLRPVITPANMQKPEARSLTHAHPESQSESSYMQKEINRINKHTHLKQSTCSNTKTESPNKNDKEFIAKIDELGDGR